eukprot:CAMPEP_0113618974 /NCGR_PEP_ID=MMETSP0017_2-20120614/9626_1 /TAXON_ID=2856 /ORGANISM="Cylindrotheca closterium" /LENGTH=119 /DNA_ID=CAMNT_0000528525 /DNA_START=78 /DNA_END=437 /DNA_ORIENTATION=- /assembly_acc=CAM_ASM_000147
MNSLPETTFAPSVTAEGKLAFYSASTVDTEFYSGFSFDDCSSDDELLASNRSSIDVSERSSSGGNDELDLSCRQSSAIRKPTAENCDEVKTRISRNRGGKTRSSRRKPKGRRVGRNNDF